MVTLLGSTRFVLVNELAMASGSKRLIRVVAFITALMITPMLGGQMASADPHPVVHDFTIEQVLSAPFPSSLVVADQGGGVAWVLNKGGSRNIWIAEPGANGHFSARPITSYVGDDGYDLGELAWAHHGRQVVYSRGGSLEGGGPVNPLSGPLGAEGQEIWVASIDATALRRVGPGHSPVVSPLGNAVAYILDDQIWIASLAPGGQPTQLIHDRGRSAASVWSPDGARLAFVSSRGDHSLIGVYDFAAKSITWLSPSVDTDMSPIWAPDGRNVAFVRVAAGTRAFSHSRQAQPWSLWIGDPSTGAAHSAWTASEGPGSVFHPLESDQTLFWTADDRLVFPWEQSGWMQLYSIAAAGGAPTRLTDGDFEVFRAALSHDRKRIVYSSNEGDIDHRHIWELTVESNAPHQLTRGATIEDSPVVTSDGHIWGFAQADQPGVAGWPEPAGRVGAIGYPRGFPRRPVFRT
jgi:hypothetical protein